MASQYIEDRAKTLGITADQYMQIAENLPNSGAVSYGGQGNQAWNQNQTTTSNDATYQAVAQQLRLQKAMGGGTASQSNQPTQPIYSSVDQNPMYDLSRLGAAALGEQEIVNPVPGPADKKSGIGTVTQPQISQNKVTAPVGPWSNMPGVFGKQGTQQGSAPQTQALTPTAQPTAAAGANAGLNFGGNAGDFGTKVATDAINAQIQQQLSQGNAYASTGTGPPPGWHPSTGQQNQTVTPPTPQPVQTNLPPPAPVDTSNTPGQTMARIAPQISSAISGIAGAAAGAGQTAGQFGAAGGGAASDWASRFGGSNATAGVGPSVSGDGSGLSYAQKMQLLDHMSGAMSAGSDAASKWAQNAGNAYHPVQSAIPGPEDFRQQATVALQRPTTV